MTDSPATRMIRSISQLSRAAVDVSRGRHHSHVADLAAMRRAFGGWQDRDVDGAGWVDQRRSGSRLRPDTG